MNRIDWLVLRRVGSRILMLVLVFYGIISLIESLDTWRFTHIAETRGLPMALVMVMASGARWTIKTLPVTVLMGAILGIMDLKNRREMTVIKASGISIWRIVRAPVVGILLAGLLISVGLETVTTELNRSLNPTPPGEASILTPAGEVWLEQQSGQTRYVMMAQGLELGGSELNRVTVFNLGDSGERRIEAEKAKLQDFSWVFPTAVISSPGEPARAVVDYKLPTTSTPGEIALKLSSTEDMTFFELIKLLSNGVADSSIRTAALMRVIKLLAMPLVLTGSLFIAFAFTAGYRRSDTYGVAILYGILMGFVVFVITEMADRAGASGVLAPLFAALGPALVAIVIGVTILLHKEDGRV